MRDARRARSPRGGVGAPLPPGCCHRTIRRCPRFPTSKLSARSSTSGSSASRSRSAETYIPYIFRTPAKDVAAALTGNRFGEVLRRGKFLLFALADEYVLVINPMLTGRFQYVKPGTKKRAKTCLLLALDERLATPVCRRAADGQDLLRAHGRRAEHPAVRRDGARRAGDQRRGVPRAHPQAHRRDQERPHEPQVRRRHRQRLLGRDPLRGAHQPVPASARRSPTTRSARSTARSARRWSARSRSCGSTSARSSTTRSGATT